jgi:hypothetical protein
MHYLGVDPYPSDYDIQLSSDAMADRAEALRQEQYPDKSLFHPKYGFVDKTVAEEAFPGLNAWREHWEGELGREVAPAVFGGGGPAEQPKPPSSHFKDDDWMIER